MIKILFPGNGFIAGIFSFMVLLSATTGTAQSSLSKTRVADSLTTLVKASEGKAKARTYYELVSYFRRVDDSLARNCIREVRQFAAGVSDPATRAYCDLAQGLYYYSVSAFDSAAYFLTSSKNLSRGNEPYAYINANNALGNIYISSGKAEKGLESLLDGLREAERNADFKPLVMKIKSNITWAYLELKRYRDCIDEGLRAVRQAGAGSQLYVLYIYNNIAVSYGALGMLDSAKTFANRSLDLAVRENDLFAAANAHFVLGTAYANAGQYPLAIQEYLNAKPYREKLGNPFYLVSDLYTLAELYNKTGAYEKGIEYGLEALKLAKRNNLTLKLEDTYYVLARNFEGLKDYQQASIHYKLWAIVKDSLYKNASARAMADMQTRYETEKKERALAETRVQVEQRSKQLLIAGALLVFVCGLAVMGYRTQRVKQQRLRLKAELTEVKAKNALQDERLRISQELHDNIGSQLTFVGASLDSLGQELTESRLEEIKKLTAATISELRKTVWLITTQSATLEEFVIKLRAYIPGNSRPPVYIELQGDVQREIQAQVANHLFRIIQEGVNNAIKHAQASAIIVTIMDSGHALTFTIADDGRGFVPSASASGFGLRSIDKRVKSLNGKVQIYSKPGKTVVQVVISS